MHGADESPPAAVDGRAELGGSLLHHAPVRTQHVEAAERRGAQGEQGEAEAAGGSGAGRGDLRSDGDLEAGMGVGAELQTGVAQGEPVCGAVDQLVGVGVVLRAGDDESVRRRAERGIDGVDLDACGAALQEAEREQVGLNRRVDDALARASVTFGNGTDEYLEREPLDSHHQDLFELLR